MISLCMTNEASRQEDVWGSEGIARPSLISARDEGKWSALSPCCFTPWKDFAIPIGQESKLICPLENLAHLSHLVKSISDI
jgi:hypothetical protein